MASTAPQSAKKVFTPEGLRSAARQSEGCHKIPVRLRKAIKIYLRDQDKCYMRRKVLKLSQSFNDVKKTNLLMASSTSRELVDDPLKSLECSRRWKIKSSYGDIGLEYKDDEAMAYVASRMPAVYSACYRVLKEVRRRLPEFTPSKVLDFGSGTCSTLWAMREVWPGSIERINMIEPSSSMQRAGKSLLRGLKDLPLIQSYESILGLSKSIIKSERKHDLVIASYVLGEIPSWKDRITLVRQLWNFSQDVLVLVEPGTPHGFGIMSQARSHILWMEKRKCRKAKVSTGEVSKHGAFVVAPCPHDGVCPLVNTDKYCHFVQRLERTSTQRIYKRSKGNPLRGYEDEKFCFVVLRKGQRPQEPWPMDGMKFGTLEDVLATRSPEDMEIDYEDMVKEEETKEVLPSVDVRGGYDSDVMEMEEREDGEVREEEEERERAGLGSGWGRIVYSPVRRGRRVEMNVCRATKRDGSEGSFDRLVITKWSTPKLHLQARKSLWGDLWPS